MLVVAALVKFTSPGPLIFKQKRIGLHNREFNMYKFRSMRVQTAAEEKKAWTIMNGPRVTPVGKFIRSTSLDELPQLINIFIGNMSLVGPRPIVEEELEWYGDKKNVLLSVRPGLTGWWATNGRSEVSYPERCDYELYYVYNCSLLLDIKILFKTFSAVFSRKGAM